MGDDDDHDEQLLDELRTFFARVDPVPPLVIEAGKAALGWRRLDADLAELLSDSTLEAGSGVFARAGGAPARSVSFRASELTIDIEIQAEGESRTILGQLSPPLTAVIEIQTPAGSLAATAQWDTFGRFRAELHADGPIRLRVLASDPGSVPSVETSWITI